MERKRYEEKNIRKKVLLREENRKENKKINEKRCYEGKIQESALREEKKKKITERVLS